MKKVTNFVIVPDYKNKKIYLKKKGGVFGMSKTLDTYTSDQFQNAVDSAKMRAGNYRPSRVTILDGHGKVRRQWDYKEFDGPRDYENNPRRNYK